MKRLTILLFMVAVTLTSFAQEKAGKKDTSQHVTLYTYACSMHPNFISDKPGKCPKCGMEMVQLSLKEQLKSDVTKTYTCPTHIDVISTQPGKCPKCGNDLLLSPKEKLKAEIAKIYYCPMHPDQTSAKPGRCPKCGMEMVEKKPEKKDEN